MYVSRIREEKNKVFAVKIHFITWRNDLMGDRFPEDRNCRFIQYMFVVDSLTTRRACTLHMVVS